MQFDPQSLTPSERYKLLIGGIVPRPIAVVSTVSPDGAFNLAPYSFFNGVGSDPMTLLFCPANDARGDEKDSLRNAKPVKEGGTGEFVVNVAPDALMEQVAAAAEALPYGESEFELTGLTPLASHRVGAPRVAQSPIAFECRTLQVVRTHVGAPAGGNVVIGEVVWVHVDDDVIDERLHLDAAKLDLVGRMGGFGYARTRERFELRSGKAALSEGRRSSS